MKNKKNKKSSALPFDTVRQFAQPLGIDLSKWEGRIIKTEKGTVCLLSVAERADQLFGKNSTEAIAQQIEHEPKDLKQILYPEFNKSREVTTLDRVHVAMLLQAGGYTKALRALINTETKQNPQFLRLANALSALYPPNSNEKRLLDAMLVAIPRLAHPG